MTDIVKIGGSRERGAYRLTFAASADAAASPVWVRRAGERLHNVVGG
jgi:hypothetical protein